MTMVLTGVAPVVPTIFHDDEGLDLPGLRRVVDYLVDGEVDAMCALANFAEQFSLTDAERDVVAATVLEQVAGRIVRSHRACVRGVAQPPIMQSAN